MHVYYHASPRKNVSRILRVGLRPSSGLTKLDWLHPDLEGAYIWLARDPGEAYYHLLSETEEVSGRGTPRFWALLRIELPSNWPISEDEYGYLVTDKPIPPECIWVERMDQPGEKTLRAKLYEEIEKGPPWELFSEDFWTRAEKRGWR